MGDRRQYLLVAALFAVVLALAILLAPEEQQNEADLRASSYLVTPRGTRGLFWTLEELEIPVARRVTPLVEADSIRGPLLVLAPGEPLSPAEVGALMAWVDRGGTLVYAAGQLDALPLGEISSPLDSLGLAVRPPRWARETDTVTALPVPHRWTAGMRPVRDFRLVFADTSRALRRGKGAAEILLRTPQGRAAAVVVRRGRGRVLALADATPLGNRALKENTLALLVARAVAEGGARGGTVWFDEYHHGFRGDGSPARGVGRFLFGTRPGWATLQLLVVAAGLLLLLGRRFGAPLPVPPARRRSPLEHVDALAGAYRQAGARGVARRLLVAGLARRLGRRPPRETDDAGAVLTQITTRLPVAQEAARELQDEWNHGDRGNLVALTRGVDRLLEEVKRP